MSNPILIFGRFHGSYPSSYDRFYIPNGINIIMYGKNENVFITTKNISTHQYNLEIGDVKTVYYKLSKNIIKEISGGDRETMNNFILLREGTFIPDIFLQIMDTDSVEHSGLFSLALNQNEDKVRLTKIFDHSPELGKSDLYGSFMDYIPKPNYHITKLSKLLQFLVSAQRAPNNKILFITSACLGTFFYKKDFPNSKPNHIAHILNKTPINSITSDETLLPMKHINPGHKIQLYRHPIPPSQPIPPKQKEPVKSDDTDDDSEITFTVKKPSIGGNGLFNSRYRYYKSQYLKLKNSMIN